MRSPDIIKGNMCLSFAFFCAQKNVCLQLCRDAKTNSSNGSLEKWSITAVLFCTTELYSGHLTSDTGQTMALRFLSPARRSGGGGYWLRLGCPSVRPSVRPASGCPHFVSGAELGNPCMDFFNFWHTHPLGGVDVPFRVFEILPA